MFNDLFKYLITVLFLCNSFILIGYIVNLWIKLPVSKYSLPFVYYLLGVIISVCFFATILAKGNSFMLLILILFLLLLFFARREGLSKVSAGGVDFKGILMINILGILFFTLKGFSVIDSNLYPVIHLARDDMFYANVSSFLSEFGVESYNLDWFSSPEKVAAVPYHYPELWLNGMIVKLFKFNSVHAFAFISFSLLGLILASSIQLIINHKNLKIGFALSLILVVTIAFSGDIYFGLLSSRNNWSLRGGLSLIDNAKLVVIFPLIVLIQILVDQKLFKSLIILLLLIPLFNFGFFLGILGFSVLLIIYFYLKRIFNRRELIELTIVFLIYGSAIFIWNRINSSNYTSQTNMGLSTLISYYDNFAKIKTFLHYLFNYLLISLIILVPLFILYYEFTFKAFKSEIIWIYGVLLLIAICIAALLYFIINTSQIFTMLLNLVAHLLLFNMIINSLKSYRERRIAFFVSILILFSSLYLLYDGISSRGSIFNNYGQSYVKCVLKEFNNNHSTVIGRYITDSDIVSEYDFNPNTSKEGYLTLFNTNAVVMHTINILTINDRESLHDFYNTNKRTVINSTFIGQLNANIMKPLDPLNFVKTQSIKYIFFTKNALIPDTLSSKLNLICQDDLTGEKLYKFNL